MNLDGRTLRIVLITIVITAFIVIVLLALAAWRGFRIVIDTTINNIVNTVEKQCLDDQINYRGRVFVPSSPHRYNHRLATILWDVAGAVSSSNCKEIEIPPPFNRQHLFVASDGDGPRMFGQAFWSEGEHKKNYCCLVFSGTYSSSQWNNNLNLNLSSAAHLNGAHTDAQVHSGFVKTYDSIRDEVWDWLEENRWRFRWVIVTGRSLGGAISTLCAYDLARELKRRNIGLIHYTFASPRVGNPVFADDFNQKVPQSMRIYNTEDLVVDLPPPVWRSNTYKHVGRPRNNRPFTSNQGDLVFNHIEAYRELPA